MKCTCNEKPRFPLRVRASVDGFTRIVSFQPGYVCEIPRDNPRNHGVHGMDMLFALKGSEGAVEFVVYTGWMPDWDYDAEKQRVLPANLGYHSRVPLYEGQMSRSGCPYLDGAPCYCDGSGLAAIDLFKVFVKYGESVLWAELEVYYKRNLEH